MDDADTIAAISSPVGEGGIGIIRMSGPDAHSILKQIFRPRNTMKEHASHHLNLGFIFDPQNNTDIDEVFVVVMNAPATYTREMMAEVYCHGGLAAQRHILEIMLSAGARLAEPGEFTKRAYLNGRIDLTQAESVLDIIESHTEQELHAALAQTKGQLALAIEALRKEIIALLAEVEADIDFPDEDISLSQQMWSSRLANLENEINTLIESYYEGRAITQGLDVVIIGRTNVGKSSLLNALALANKAIVTHIPGTTRDLVEDKVIVKGVKFRITDTAGLRSSIDPIELIGIDRARGRIMEADIILWVLDGSVPYSAEDEHVFNEVQGCNVVAILNKSDLPQRIDDKTVESKCIVRLLKISALTGWGLEDVKQCLYEIYEHSGVTHAGLVITHVRHRDLLQKVHSALGRSREAISAALPLEIVALELREALLHLGDIIGETSTDDVLNEIFSRFCIGK